MSKGQDLQVPVAEGDKFKSRVGAIMSMVGMCIGLGNMWRFPYLVGEYGGGAFVFAYIICLLLVVIPLALVEAGYGKGIGGGVMDAYRAALKNEKASKIIGGVFTVVYGTMNFYFIAICGTCAYFMYASARGLWNFVPPAEIYPQAQGNMVLMIALTAVFTLFIGLVVYRGASGGIERVSNIMMPLLFIFFILVIVISAFTVEGIGKGYDFYLNPDFSRLAHADIWVAAMGQALFSVGVGPGCVYIYGAYFKKTDDVTVNVFTVCVLDTCAAMLAGMAIIPACIALGLDPESGARLIFVVLPTLLAQIPLGNLFGILIFSGIFFAGITSAVAQLEVPLATFAEGLKLNRRKVAIASTVITLAGALISAVSEEFLNFFSNVSGNYGFIVTAGIGAVVYCYVYGVKRIREEHINTSSDVRLGAWFDVLVRFVAAPLMILIMANSIFPFM
jgi:NSS family neurotransmitter:Na+ symporter